MNEYQKLYEDTLETVRDQFRQVKNLNHEARLEWYHEVRKLLQSEMDISPQNHEDFEF